jgi:outer membrane protein TolC
MAAVNVPASWLRQCAVHAGQFDTVDKRVRAGDASKVDLSIARAELAEQAA